MQTSIATETVGAETQSPAVEAEPDALDRLLRMFGWAMIGLLIAFLSNNILTNWLNVPGARTVFEGGGIGAWFQAALYPAALIAAVALVVSTADRTPRADADRFSNANIFLIRASFWAVVFVGLADSFISFLRVEDLLPVLFGEQLATDLGRSQFRGPYVHIPLIVAGIVMAAFTRTLGFTWLALLVVVAELSIVIGRFIFSYEQAFMGDLVRFWYAALFLFASAYTLVEDGHVRVDVFYAALSERTKGALNAIGCLFMGIVLCWVILYFGMSGKSAIINSAVLSFEVTQAGFGMYVKYLMAAFLGVFAISMLVQFTAYFMESVADYRQEPGHREPSHEIIQ